MVSWKERVRTLLEKRKMTQTELAEKLGVTKATVSVWLREDITLTEKNTIKLQRRLAPYLGVTPEYIRDGDGQDVFLKLPDTGRSIPLLNSTDISHWVVNHVVSDTAIWIHCPIECSEKTFCYSMTNSSMEGSDTHGFPYQSIVFIDPDLPLEFNKTCLFHDHTPLLGSYQEWNGKPQLVFANARFDTVHVVKDNYIGRAIGFFAKIE